MVINNLYHRLFVTQQLVALLQNQMQNLQQDLIANALDPIKVKRRFRMMKQLSLYQAQLLDKIPNFHSDDAKDFQRFMDHVSREVFTIVHRSS